MRDKPNSFIIFSVDQAHETESENAANRVAVLRLLRDTQVPVLAAIGSYKGVMERSFIVPMSHRQLVFVIAHEYNQESILEVDDNRAYLLTLKSGGEVQETALGALVRANPLALPEAWTRIGDSYWTTEKTI